MSYITKSPWIMHYDASSCNGCDIEVLACLTPMYDVERFGIVNTGNPKHADILLITGSVNEQTQQVVRNLYEQMPEPKVVVAIGICASSGGVFRECYNVAGGVDKVIPVDVFVPGCAARPELIIDGVVQALGVLDKRRAYLASVASGIGELVISQADESDLPEVLAVQKTAYQSESELYNDPSLPPLQQTLEQLREAFKTQTLFKAVINGKVVGSIRGYVAEGTGHISRLSVHPYFQSKGVGKKLVAAIETRLADAKRFEVFTWHKSKRNLALYGKLGYKEFKTDQLNSAVNRVYLEKVK